MDDIPPGDSELRAEIEYLESRIDTLAETIEGCRKFMLAARIAIAAGGALGLAMLAGLVAPEIGAMMAAVGLLLGGIIVLGSNRSTRDEAEAELREAEAERADLIGRIDLRVVEGGAVQPAGSATSS